MSPYRDPERGLVERCDLCGAEAEVDDVEDAQAWGINHHAARHERPDEPVHAEDCDMDEDCICEVSS